MFREVPRTDFVAGTLKPTVQLGAALAQRRDRTPDRRFPLADVGINLLLMGKIKGNRPIYLLKRERREILANRLWRVSSRERIHDGVEGDTRPGDVKSAVTLFDIFATLQVSSIEVSGRGAPV